MSRTLLGFDYGLKRIGVACGEELTGSSRPLTTVAVRDNKPDWDHIERLIKEWKPGLLIVGLPLGMDGEEHEMSAAARKFANRLHGRFGLPVELADERLSSHEAEAYIHEQRGRGRMKRGKAKASIDQIAAAVILQTWLEG